MYALPPILTLFMLKGYYTYDGDEEIDMTTSTLERGEMYSGTDDSLSSMSLTNSKEVLYHL